MLAVALARLLADLGIDPLAKIFVLFLVPALLLDDV